MTGPTVVYGADEILFRCWSAIPLTGPQTGPLPRGLSISVNLEKILGALGHVIGGEGGYHTRGIAPPATMVLGFRSRKIFDILDAKSCMSMYFERYCPREKVTSRSFTNSIAPFPPPNKKVGGRLSPRFIQFNGFLLPLRTTSRDINVCNGLLTSAKNNSLFYTRRVIRMASNALKF